MCICAQTFCNVVCAFPWLQGENDQPFDESLTHPINKEPQQQLMQGIENVQKAEDEDEEGKNIGQSRAY